MSNETRKLPTRPGWWMVSDSGMPPIARSVISGESGLIVHMGGVTLRVDAPDFTWLAPIPGPAVLAALAEYGDAVLQRGPMQARGVNVSDALLALEDAIRSERDGAA